MASSSARISRFGHAVTVLISPSSTMSIGSIETVTSSGTFTTFTGNITVATLVAGCPVMTPEAMVAVAVMVTWAMPAEPVMEWVVDARCGIPEYWILALPEARLQVYREPAGDGYRSVTNHAAGDNVAPLARPDAESAVDDLLP